MVLTKLRLGFLEILKIDILTIFLSFSLTFDPMGAKIQNATHPTNRSQMCWDLSWIFLPMVSQNYVLDFSYFKFQILKDFFENFKFTNVGYGEIKNLDYLENERS